MLLADAQESGRTEREAINRALPIVEGVVLGGSRLAESAIRTLAQQVPMVVLNRVVAGMPCVVTDNPRGIRCAVEHLGELGHTTITYVAGPEASWLLGCVGAQRWRRAMSSSCGCGHDNIFGCDFCCPALTTVAAPLRALGTAGVQQLISQVHGRALPVAEPAVLPARLVVRGFTAQRSRKRTSPAWGTTKVS